MLYIGSNGETFFNLLSFLESNCWIPPFDDDSVLNTIQTLLQVFAYERSKLRPNYDLHHIIRLLIDKRAECSDKYKVLVKRYFNVDIDRIDFERDWDLIGDQMTSLVQTEFNSNDIQPFLTTISNKTQLVILNAITFKG